MHVWKIDYGSEYVTPLFMSYILQIFFYFI